MSLCHNPVSLRTEVPEWCDSPASFIAYHRQVLESDTVSSTLHTWLDLVFGVLLGGQGAIEHRNVPLPSCHASSHTAPHATGFRQVGTLSKRNQIVCIYPGEACHF